MVVVGDRPSALGAGAAAVETISRMGGCASHARDTAVVSFQASMILSVSPVYS